MAAHRRPDAGADDCGPPVVLTSTIISQSAELREPDNESVPTGGVLVHQNFIQLRAQCFGVAIVDIDVERSLKQKRSSSRFNFCFDGGDSLSGFAISVGTSAFARLPCSLQVESTGTAGGYPLNGGVSHDLCWYQSGCGAD